MDKKKTRKRRATLKPRRARKVGLPPGTLVHVGDVHTEKVSIEVIQYNAGLMERKAIESLDELDNLSSFDGVTWVRVTGVHKPETVEAIGRRFDLHPLALEDVLNTDQRPKVDTYESYLYIVLKIFQFNEASEEHVFSIEVDQFSLFLMDRVVVTFQERPVHIFDAVIRRLEEGRPRIRAGGSDYLAYVLIDAIVDGYFVVLERLGEKMEAVEERMLQGETDTAFPELQNLRRHMLLIRRAVWPLREVIGQLMRDESVLIRKETRLYLRDVYDHTIHVLDTVETYRDLISGLVDLYLNVVSTKLNEIMKVLTVIATIFIPLTFIAGVYGMNFRYMPELEWRWGYFAVWGVMIAIGISMLIYFRRRRWL